MLALRKLANPKHFQTAKPAHVANSSSASTSSSPKILTQIVRHYAVAKKKTTTVAAKKKTSVAKKVSAVAKKSGKKELSLLEQAIALANEGKLEKSLQTFQLALRETPEDYFVHLNLGVVAERSGEMELAQHSYRKASSLDENELTPKYYLARVLATIQTDDKKGNLEQAEALLKECIEKEPEWPEALISMGSVKMEQGKKKTASTIYKQALTILKAREKGEVKHEMSPREIADCKVLAYRNLAEAYLLRSMVQKSIDIFKKVLVIRKADYKAMMRLGEVYELYVQDLEKAWSYYDAAVKIAPEAPGIHSLLGRLYSHPDFKSFDLDKSRRYYETAMRFDPKPELFFPLGWINLEQGEVEKGVQCLMKVRELDTDKERFAAASGLLAEIEMLQGTDKSIQKAIDFLTEAIEANPKNIDLQVDLAKACILSGRPKSAMGILEDVTKANPKHAKAAAVLAGLYFDLKKPEMGLMYAKKAAKLDPKDQQVQFWLGKHAFDTKDIDSAIKHLTKAVEGIPPPIPADVMERWKNNKSLDGLGDIPMPPLYAGEACMILGLCLEEKQDIASAREVFDAACQYEPDNIQIYVRAGTMLMEAGQNDEAIKYFKTASVLDPTAIMTNYNLGTIYGQASEFAKAVIYYEKVLAAAAKPESKVSDETMYYTYNNLSAIYASIAEEDKDKEAELKADKYAKLADKYQDAAPQKSAESDD